MAIYALTETLDYFIRELRLPVRKALDPNHPQDFLKIVAALKKATMGLVGQAEADALKAAIAQLDVDWKHANPKQIDKVVFAAKASLNPVKNVLPKIEQHFEANAKSIGLLTKGSAKSTFGFDVQADLTAVDHKVLGHIALSQGNYIKDEYGKRSDAFALKAKQIIHNGIQAGWGTKDIAEKLRTDLAAQQINRSQAYWEVVAGSFANRARTYSNLSTYQDALVQWFTFEAVMDERTSEVCRFMHGKRFRVEQALGHFAASDEAGDPEDIKNKQPWLQTGRKADGTPFIYARGSDGTKKPVADIVKPGMGGVDTVGQYANALSDKFLAARGIMTPPLHGNCRSTILPDMSTEGMVPMKPSAPAAPSFALQPSPGPNDAPPPKLNPSAYDNIQDAPAEVPEQTGFKFGPGGVQLKPIEIPAPAPTLAQPDPPTKPLVGYAAVNAKKGPALEALDALKAAANGSNMVAAPIPIKANPFLYNNAQEISKAFEQGLAKPVKKLVENLSVPEGVQVDAAAVEKLLKDPKKILKVEVKFVKVGKDVFVVSGYEAVVAAKLLDKGKVRGVEITKDDVKKIQDEMLAAAKQAATAPKAPPIPPAPSPPPKPAPPPPPAPLGPAVKTPDIMHEKTNRPGGGSNNGAFYKGVDGHERFVKLYKDSAQAHGEILSNALYAALGFASAEAVTWRDEFEVGPGGKKEVRQAYAAKLVDGKQLGENASKAQAQEFFKGFAADVLLGNWDAAGRSVDNAFVTKDGRIMRIDNGGALLMRAMGGRKHDSQLYGIPELDTFFPGSSISNPGYHLLASKAGYKSVDDFKDDFKKQVGAITELEKKFGTWSNFVSQYAPGLTGEDRDKIVKMLDERSKKLREHVAFLDKPKPPEAKYDGTPYRAPAIKGVLPKSDLKIEDLPEHDDVDAFKSPKGKTWRNTPEKLPNGEKHADYLKRVDQHMAKIAAESKSAINDFTGSAYSSVRDAEVSEAKGEKPERYGKSVSDKIQKAYKVATPMPGTVFRGIEIHDEAVALAMIRTEGTFRLGQGNTGATSSSAWHAPVASERFMHGHEHEYGGHKIFFQIHQKSGIPIERISGFNDKSGMNETEVLLPKDAEFKIVSVARWKGKKKIIIIELEEI